VSQLAIVVRLKPGAEPRAAELLRNGPPFDPGERGFERHAVYLSATEVVFVFEGPEVEWIVSELVDEPSSPLAAAFDAWRPLLDAPPRIARRAYAWQRQASEGRRPEESA
jgi:hypothetical protein